MLPFCDIRSIIPINNEKVYEPDAHTLFLCPVDPSFYSVHKFILTPQNFPKRYEEDYTKTERKDYTPEALFPSGIQLKTEKSLLMKIKRKLSGLFSNNMPQALL